MSVNPKTQLEIKGNQVQNAHRNYTKAVSTCCYFEVSLKADERSLLYFRKVSGLVWRHQQAITFAQKINTIYLRLVILFSSFHAY